MVLIIIFIMVIVVRHICLWFGCWECWICN